MIVKPSIKNTDLANIYMPIADPLAQVEKILVSEISSDTPWVNRLLEHNWIRGGKRIRPVLTLLSGAAVGQLSPSHNFLAAAVEMVHAATLVHDDVIDGAEIRRHLPTVNSAWGNRTSVLLGDFLFTHGFYVASLAENPTAMRILAESSNRVCEGEIRQNAWQGRYDIQESDYLEMISDKTGQLCSCSCRLGALLSGANEELTLKFADYGLQLGVAFQIIDDVLDLVGLQDRVGKTLGTDLMNKKLTLPIIHCLRESNSSDAKSFIQKLASGNADSLEIVEILNRNQSIDYARSVASEQLQQAILFAESLPNNEASKALAELANFVLNRVY